MGFLHFLVPAFAKLALVAMTLCREDNPDLLLCQVQQFKFGCIRSVLLYIHVEVPRKTA